MPRKFTVSPFAAPLALSVPGSAQARIPTRVGISDQQVAVFDQPDRAVRLGPLSRVHRP